MAVLTLSGCTLSMCDEQGPDGSVDEQNASSSVEPSDDSDRRTRLRGEELTLTPRAVLLLEYLMGHPDELLTRERLLSTLWGYEFAVSTRAIDHRIAELRKVLNDNAQSPKYIETVQQSGYRIVGEVDGA